MNCAKKRLKYLREESGLSQVEIAKDLNVSRSSIAAYENENNEVIPSIEILIKYADFFDTTVDYLVCRTNTKFDIQQFAELEINLLEDIQALIIKYKKLEQLDKSKSPK